MEVRDPVHGSILIHNQEIPIIRNPFFQRLRNIKQLGLSEYAFPGATHSRYLHSIGVMHVGTRVFDFLFKDFPQDSDLMRLKETLRLACLLHDIGHAPLSHSTESVMPHLSALNLPKKYVFDQDRQATHEDYTVKIIIDSQLTDSFKEVNDKYGVTPHAIADLITGRNQNVDYFKLHDLDTFPLLNRLVSSEIDCDRMDYLLRDSYFCGVSYGRFDIDWLIQNFHICEIDKVAYLGISDRALSTFDDFLLGRFHMFLMVYFHYRAVCLEQILMRFFKDSPGEYSIPGNIDEYLQHDDYFLMRILRSSKNRYAKQIVSNTIPYKIFDSFDADSFPVIEELLKYFDDNSLEYIHCSSSGRLSKYYNQPTEDNGFPIMVVRKIPGQRKFIYKDIHRSTNLFKKFSKAHIVNRVYCYMEDIPAEMRNKIFEIIGQELSAKNE